jgi:hypothetical protein
MNVHTPKAVCQDTQRKYETVKGCLLWTDRYNHSALETPSEDYNKVFRIKNPSLQSPVDDITRSPTHNHTPRRSRSPLYNSSPDSHDSELGSTCIGCREELGNQQAHMGYGGCGYEPASQSSFDTYTPYSSPIDI